MSGYEEVRRAWIKSARSAEDNNCVEQCGPTAYTVAVRDTKQRGLGPELHMPVRSYENWLVGAKAGEFDHLIG